MANIAEYIWLDGTQPTQSLRSKTRLLELQNENPQAKDCPIWSFDGSSTYQSEGSSSDLTLQPVRVVRDPIRGNGNYLVLCEVFNNDKTAHTTNHRATLRDILAQGADKNEPWVGFEQEFTLFSGRNPLGWPENGFPRPQGPFYCGVGAENVYGRDIVEHFTTLALEAGLLIYGTNAEVMPGQWEYQVGYRGFNNDTNDALTFCDHQHLARWLLCRVAEEYGVSVSFDNKPVQGDWNGAGCHTNFSTRQMRTPGEGIAAIEHAVSLLSQKHNEHIALYGHGLAARLTGQHETCSISEFRSGVADRGSSIRIPSHVQEKGYGYFEDRRPGANSDPYLVTARILATICQLDERAFNQTTITRTSRVDAVATA